MEKLKPFWLTRVVLLGLMVSFAAACDDATSPEDVDPTDAATAIDGAVNQFFDGNEAMQSLDVFGQLIGGALAGGDVAIFDLIPDLGSGSMGGLTRSFQASVAKAAALQRSGGPARIPVGMLGNTFVYNPATGQYEVDPARTGAPSNAVRFILYAVDPILQEPVLDNQGQPIEIGYIDIADTSDFPTVTIGFTAVVSGDTLVDVDVSGAFTQTTVDLTFSGFLSDGSQRLNFGFDLAGTETGFEVSFTLNVAGYSIDFSFSGSETIGNITATISDGSDTILFNLTVDAADNIDGSIAFNGTVVALISGTTQEPVVTNGDGDPLTQAEIDALEDLFEGIGEIFELFSDLGELALFLLLLGTI